MLWLNSIALMHIWADHLPVVAQVSTYLFIKVGVRCIVEGVHMYSEGGFHLFNDSFALPACTCNYLNTPECTYTTTQESFQRTDRISIEGTNIFPFIDCTKILFLPQPNELNRFIKWLNNTTKKWKKKTFTRNSLPRMEWPSKLGYITLSPRRPVVCYSWRGSVHGQVEL